MKYTLLFEDSTGRHIEIWQELPSKKRHIYPTVLLVPGFGIDLHEHGLFDEITDVLCKNGYQVFRFSFAGTGKSEGDFSQTTVLDQIRQLREVITYISQDRFTDRVKIGLLAQSFGTVIATAALPLPEIASFVFLSSIAYPVEVMTRLFRREGTYDPDGISTREQPDKQVIKIGPKFWKNLTGLQLVENMHLMTAPILFIHGSLDRKVKPWEAEEYFTAASGRKRFLIIKKSDHGFTREFRPKLLELTSQWFNETLLD